MAAKQEHSHLDVSSSPSQDYGGLMEDKVSIPVPQVCILTFCSRKVFMLLKS